MIEVLQQIGREIRQAYTTSFGDLRTGLPEELQTKPFPTKGLYVALGLFLFWAAFIGF